MAHITFLTSSGEAHIEIPCGKTVLDAAILAGVKPDAPCGGKGTCKKCKALVNGEEVLACQTLIEGDLTVRFPEMRDAHILTKALRVDAKSDQADRYAIAFDIGTTTVVGYLLDGMTGKLLSQASSLNPQTAFGADVVTRIQYLMKVGTFELTDCIRKTISDLTLEACKNAGVDPNTITMASVVGNTAMHHLYLGIDPKPLMTPPYMPRVFGATVMPARPILPISEKGILRVLPNIAGFVGADTVGCLVSTRMDTVKDLTLMIDIGTNGEMVLGDNTRRIACSTAAGPAFEGAKISCGMRGVKGAVDHVYLHDGEIFWHVIGDCKPVGLCGSGLLDLISTLLDTGFIDGSGHMQEKTFRLGDTDVTLTQKDVREVQLAKAAIRAGIELMADKLGRSVKDIKSVLLAGAFGSFMDPVSACNIGMIPPVLVDRIRPIGNAAGEGAKLCALSEAEFEYSKKLAREVEFLELASLPEFQDCYVDALNFEEDA